MSLDTIFREALQKQMLVGYLITDVKIEGSGANWMLLNVKAETEVQGGKQIQERRIRVILDAEPTVKMS